MHTFLFPLFMNFEEYTLEELKGVLANFTEGSDQDYKEDIILNEINNSKSTIKKEINSNKNIINLLKELSMKIENMKKENEKMGLEECSKCIKLLSKIQNDIHLIKSKELKIQKKTKGVKMALVISTLLYVFNYLLKKMYL
ncbi:hypothetical protein NCER_100728 [Vairimorpha ceranae BRL01]|uniref:Uncharacterized protein n=2 Tax=Vairimorpha ceranae TaxID=40302 RepID=C4V8B7_VAIC1|nr:hypothetical protein NCER_100728 [Vairimorpha ceranae BRL01]